MTGAARWFRSNGITLPGADELMIADDDGVVIVPKAEAGRVAAASAAREAKEAGTRQRLAAGELGLDVYGMREALAKAGLKYFDDEAALQKGLQMQREAQK